MGLLKNRVPLVAWISHHFLIQKLPFEGLVTNPQRSSWTSTRTQRKKWRISFGQWSWWLNVRKPGVRCTVIRVASDVDFCDPWSGEDRCCEGFCCDKFWLSSCHIIRMSLKITSYPLGFKRFCGEHFLDPGAVKGVADCLPSWPSRRFKAGMKCKHIACVDAYTRTHLLVHADMHTGANRHIRAYSDALIHWYVDTCIHGYMHTRMQEMHDPPFTIQTRPTVWFLSKERSHH